ncbi:MAG: hypothetical protein H7287_13060, partial [Thermoleophilia bacterium]|nr:hypothetical protein [Thermoleophilia bacterium]
MARACALVAFTGALVLAQGASMAAAAPGMNEGSAMPVTGFEIVSAGHSNTVFGLQTNGSLTAWGENSARQTGDGGSTDRNTPGFTFASDPTFVGVKQVGSGTDFSVALKADGTVWAWGNNAIGQLGNGTLTTSATPVAVTGMTGVRQISIGAQCTLALKADGTIWAWGQGGSGELGNGASTSSNVPVQVDFTSRAAGTLRLAKAIYTGTDFSMAIMADGTVWGWGRNANRQLALAGADRATPVQADAALTGARSLSLGDAFGAAILPDGTIRTWGADGSGQLGNGATIGNQNTPQAPGVTKALQVVTGDDHMLALLADGTIMGWGSNLNGQLGFSGADRTSPLALTAFGAAGSTRFLGAGLNSSFQVRADGTVYGTGENSAGTLATTDF